MAQYNYFNYGQAASDAETIRGQKQQNALRGMQVAEQENILANRQKAQEIREQYRKIPEQIQQLESVGMFEEADQLRMHYIDQQVNGIKVLGTLRDSIDEENYKQFRQDLIASGAVDGKLMPTEYSDDWFRKEIERQRGDIETHTRRWADQGVTYSQDFMSQDGSIIWEGTPFEASADVNARKKGAEGDGEGFAMKAADTNSIRNASALLFGGMWDPQNGSYIGLNKDSAKDVAAISEEAARIYNKNQGRLPHDMAVARAARKLNINIRSLQNNSDPLGILGQ